jgi:putative PEP-CTERM system histidine kinase
MPTEDENAFVQKTGTRVLVPLMVKERVEGIVVLGEQLVREKFIYEDYDLMKTLARQAGLSIVNFRLLEELAEAREMAAIARVSSFVMHDLKNLTTNLSLLLDNAKDYMDDPEFRNDMIKTIRNTLIRMKDLIQKLKGVQEKQALNLKPTDLNTVILETVDEISKTRHGVNIVYQGVSAISSVDVEEIRKVILNLILNAIDAAGEKGLVRVEGGANGRSVYIRVSDDGCGMPAEFINNHLFKPFRTTKKSGLGIGLYQCKQIVEAHNGRIEVQSTADRGSVFTVYLPS